MKQDILFNLEPLGGDKSFMSENWGVETWSISTYY